MKFIGDQGNTPDFSPGWITWMASKYALDDKQRQVTYDGHTYTIEPTYTEQYMFTLVKDLNTNLTEVKDLRQAWNLLKWYRMDSGGYLKHPEPIQSIFEINQASSHIAKATRRGRGRLIVCNNKDVLNKLDKFELNDGHYEIVESVSVKPNEIILLYNGKIVFDKPFAMFNNKIYIRPDFDKYCKRMMI